MQLIDELLDAGINVRVNDPEAMDHVRAIYGDRIAYFPHRYDALATADALAVLTNWDEYANPDYNTMAALMSQPLIFDGRNLFDPAAAISNGFSYRGIGRVGPRPEVGVAPPQLLLISAGPPQKPGKLASSKPARAARKQRDRTAAS